MYDFDLIRRLCTEISAEKNEARAHELISLLQAVIKEDIDEIRIRMEFLRLKYANGFEVNAAS